jgi:hypothetical protein
MPTGPFIMREIGKTADIAVEREGRIRLDCTAGGEVSDDASNR